MRQMPSHTHRAASDRCLSTDSCVVETPAREASSPTAQDEAHAQALAHGLATLSLAASCELSLAGVRPLLEGVTSQTLAGAFKLMGVNGHSATALHIFGLLRGLGSSDSLSGLCDTHTYHAAITVGPSTARGVEAALQLLEEMNVRGVKRTPDFYTSIMNLCLRADKLQVALTMYNNMVTDGLEPLLASHHVLMDVHGRMHNWQKALAVLDTLESKEPSAAVAWSYTIAVIACGRSRRASEALDVIQRMLRAGLRPCLTTFTSFMSMFCRVGALTEACIVFETMKMAEVAPNTITYSSLINGCEKAGNLQAAMLYFKEMLSNGCEPSAVTYNTLLRACASMRHWELAFQIWTKMREEEIKPEVVSVRAWITVMHEAGCWPAVLLVFMEQLPRVILKDRILRSKVSETFWSAGTLESRQAAMDLTRFNINKAEESSVVFLGSASVASTWNASVMLPGSAIMSLHSWLSLLRSTHSRKLSSVSAPMAAMTASDRFMLSADANSVRSSHASSASSVRWTPSPVPPGGAGAAANINYGHLRSLQHSLAHMHLHPAAATRSGARTQPYTHLNSPLVSGFSHEVSSLAGPVAAAHASRARSEISNTSQHSTLLPTGALAQPPAPSSLLPPGGAMCPRIVCLKLDVAHQPALISVITSAVTAAVQSLEVPLDVSVKSTTVLVRGDEARVLQWLCSPNASNLVGDGVGSFRPMPKEQQALSAMQTMVQWKQQLALLKKLLGLEQGVYPRRLLPRWQGTYAGLAGKVHALASQLALSAAACSRALHILSLVATEPVTPSAAATAAHAAHRDGVHATCPSNVVTTHESSLANEFAENASSVSHGACVLPTWATRSSPDNVAAAANNSHYAVQVPAPSDPMPSGWGPFNVEQQQQAQQLQPQGSMLSQAMPGVQHDMAMLRATMAQAGVRTFGVLESHQGPAGDGGPVPHTRGPHADGCTGPSWTCNDVPQHASHLSQSQSFHSMNLPANAQGASASYNAVSLQAGSHWASVDVDAHQHARSSNNYVALLPSSLTDSGFANHPTAPAPADVFAPLEPQCPPLNHNARQVSWWDSNQDVYSRDVMRKDGGPTSMMGPPGVASSRGHGLNGVIPGHLGHSGLTKDSNGLWAGGGPGHGLASETNTSMNALNLPGSTSVSGGVSTSRNNALGVPGHTSGSSAAVLTAHSTFLRSPDAPLTDADVSPLLGSHIMDSLSCDMAPRDHGWSQSPPYPADASASAAIMDQMVQACCLSALEAGIEPILEMPRPVLDVPAFPGRALPLRLGASPWQVFDFYLSILSQHHLTSALRRLAQFRDTKLNWLALQPELAPLAPAVLAAATLVCAAQAANQQPEWPQALAGMSGLPLLPSAATQGSAAAAADASATPTELFAACELVCAALGLPAFEVSPYQRAIAAGPDGMMHLQQRKTGPETLESTVAPGTLYAVLKHACAPDLLVSTNDAAAKSRHSESAQTNMCNNLE